MRNFTRTRDAKLTDTSGKPATLMQITSLIRNGYAVQVTDGPSGRDITDAILRQCVAAHSAANSEILLSLIRY